MRTEDGQPAGAPRAGTRNGDRPRGNPNVEAGAGVRTELERKSVEEAEPHQRDESEEDCHASIIGLCVTSLYALLT